MANKLIFWGFFFWTMGVINADLHENDCANVSNLQLTNLTLEYFSKLVEKVEIDNPLWDIYDASNALLRVQFQDVDHANQPIQRVTKQISPKRSWSPDSPNTLKINKNTLTERERCFMVFMLEHSVKNISRTLRPFPVKKTYYIEKGVINIGGERGQTVATSQVLLGVLASQYKDIELNLEELFGTQYANHDRYIDLLFLETLGAVLPLPSNYHKEESNGKNYFEPKGHWVSTGHTQEFQLEKKPFGPTNALLLGAVDGLLIGRSLQTLDSVEGLKLSTVLKSYYSRHGIVGNTHHSFCKRTQTVDQGKFTETCTALYKLDIAKEDGGLAVDAEHKCVETYKHMQSALERESKALHATTSCRDKWEFDDAYCTDSSSCRDNINFDDDLYLESHKYRDCLDKSGCSKHDQDIAVEQLFEPSSVSEVYSCCDSFEVSLFYLVFSVTISLLKLLFFDFERWMDINFN